MAFCGVSRVKIDLLRDWLEGSLGYDTIAVDSPLLVRWELNGAQEARRRCQPVV